METDRLADAINTLAIEVTLEMKALRDAIDDLRTEYVHAIRNAECPYLAEAKAVRHHLPRVSLGDALEMDLSPRPNPPGCCRGRDDDRGPARIEKNTRADAVPEVLACARCDACSPESLAAAVQEGWTSICRDDGTGWCYLGVCPNCQAEANQTAEPELHEPNPQKSLFV